LHIEVCFGAFPVAASSVVFPGASYFLSLLLLLFFVNVPRCRSMSSAAIVAAAIAASATKFAASFGA